MRFKKIFYTLLISGLLLSCSDFLEVEPSKNSSLEITTAEQLDLILNAHLTHNNWVEKTPLSTDNWGMTIPLYNERPVLYLQDYLQHYLWDTRIAQSEDKKWAGLYQNIWDANMIINSVNENMVTGSTELKEKVKAEAHYIRAYCFFELATTYCLHPTEANMYEAGIPLRLSTDFEENVSRSSLSDTYAQIESDINEALKLKESKRKFWRASIQGVHAFAARYYLYTGNYDKAKEHATLALEGYSELLNYETSITTQETAQGLTVPDSFYYSSLGGADFFEFWKEQYTCKSILLGVNYVIPSQELLDLYDTRDLRNEFFMIQDYSILMNYNDVMYPGYSPTQAGNLASGPSVSEMHYILAECAMREGNIGQGMNEVEKVRVNRYRASEYMALQIPADQKSALQTIMDERRREFPFTLRWYDLRRINADNILDPVTVTRNFYPVEDGIVVSTSKRIDYVLEPGSRLYARPLGDEVVMLSGGQTTQNAY